VPGPANSLILFKLCVPGPAISLILFKLRDLRRVPGYAISLIIFKLRDPYAQNLHQKYQDVCFSGDKRAIKKPRTCAYFLEVVNGERLGGTLASRNGYSDQQYNNKDNNAFGHD